MGDYTEIYTRMALKSDCPEQVIAVLQYLVDGGDEPTVPDHQFFRCARWRALLQCSSYYCIPRATVSFWFDDIGKRWYLVGRSDLKNYDNEIRQFFRWIDPYIDAYPGDFVGYEMSEQASRPTLKLKCGTGSDGSVLDTDGSDVSSVPLLADAT